MGNYNNLSDSDNMEEYEDYVYPDTTPDIINLQNFVKKFLISTLAMSLIILITIKGGQILSDWEFNDLLKKFPKIAEIDKNPEAALEVLIQMKNNPNDFLALNEGIFFHNNPIPPYNLALISYKNGLLTSEDIMNYDPSGLSENVLPNVDEKIIFSYQYSRNFYFNGDMTFTTIKDHNKNIKTVFVFDMFHGNKIGGPNDLKLLENKLSDVSNHPNAYVWDFILNYDALDNDFRNPDNSYDIYVSSKLDSFQNLINKLNDSSYNRTAELFNKLNQSKAIPIRLGPIRVIILPNGQQTEDKHYIVKEYYIYYQQQDTNPKSADLLGAKVRVITGNDQNKIVISFLENGINLEEIIDMQSNPQVYNAFLQYISETGIDKMIK